MLPTFRKNFHIKSRTDPSSARTFSSIQESRLESCEMREKKWKDEIPNYRNLIRCYNPPPHPSLLVEYTPVSNKWEHAKFEMESSKFKQPPPPTKENSCMLIRHQFGCVYRLRIFLFTFIARPEKNVRLLRPKKSVSRYTWAFYKYMYV